MSHDVGWAAVFHKGRAKYTERTPSLWLTPENSALYPRYTTNIEMSRGIDGILGNEILLNRCVVTTGALAGSIVGSFFCGMIFLAGDTHIVFDKNGPDNQLVI
ncbi:4367_t:CDS:2 [Entrophospora sp. SA101]|nr:4367_t:CDS:2 [Entrophospora sp. SA101]